MADFTAPEYASYVQYMRELALEREAKKGDWFEAEPGDIFMAGEPDPDAGSAWPLESAVWLPQLADWLSLLEAAGQTEIAFLRTPRNWECGRPIPEGDGRTIELVPTGGVAPTREEAAARLWMKVTGR